MYAVNTFWLVLFAFGRLSRRLRLGCGNTARVATAGLLSFCMFLIICKMIYKKKTLRKGNRNHKMALEVGCHPFHCQICHHVIKDILPTEYSARLLLFHNIRYVLKKDPHIPTLSKRIPSNQRDIFSFSLIVYCSIPLDTVLPLRQVHRSK